MQKHSIRWFARLDGEWIPRNSGMADSSWGWDVKCSCGLETRTGDATAGSIRDAVHMHRTYGSESGWYAQTPAVVA